MRNWCLQCIECSRTICESEFKGKKFFRSYYHPFAKPWFLSRKVPRDFNCWTNWLRTDHVQLAASIFKINIALDTKCHSLVQDLNHIIWQWPNFNDSRNVLINKLFGMGYFLPHKMDFFLSIANHIVLRSWLFTNFSKSMVGICNGFMSRA